MDLKRRVNDLVSVSSIHQLTTYAGEKYHPKEFYERRIAIAVIEKLFQDPHGTTFKGKMLIVCRNMTIENIVFLSSCGMVIRRSLY